MEKEQAYEGELLFKSSGDQVFIEHKWMYTSHNLDQELKDQKYREIIWWFTKFQGCLE